MAVYHSDSYVTLHLGHVLDCLKISQQRLAQAQWPTQRMEV